MVYLTPPANMKTIFLLFACTCLLSGLSALNFPLEDENFIAETLENAFKDGNDDNLESFFQKNGNEKYWTTTSEPWTKPPRPTTTPPRPTTTPPRPTTTPPRPTTTPQWPTTTPPRPSTTTPWPSTTPPRPTTTPPRPTTTPPRPSTTTPWPSTTPPRPSTTTPWPSTTTPRQTTTTPWPSTTPPRPSTTTPWPSTTTPRQTTTTPWPSTTSTTTSRPRLTSSPRPSPPAEKPKNVQIYENNVNGLGPFASQLVNIVLNRNGVQKTVQENDIFYKFNHNEETQE